jgi:transcriptional regulator with XRE-family HTH domain
MCVRRNISEKTGERIRRARRRLGITQEELSVKTDLHLSSINRIENGKFNPALPTLNKIARALGVRPRELLP